MILKQERESEEIKEDFAGHISQDQNQFAGTNFEKKFHA